MDAPFVLSYGLLWALVVFQGLVLLGLTRSLYDLKAKVGDGGAALGEESELVGEVAPRITATDVFGRTIDTADFAGEASAVVFVSLDCSSCTPTLVELDALKGKVNGNVVVVCRGPEERCRELAERYDVGVPVIADESLAISAEFDVHVVPTAVLITSRNRIKAHGHPMRGDELIEMVDRELLETEEVV